MNDKNLIGKTVKQAEKMLKKAGLLYRVVSKDGNHFMVTMDFCPDRVNLTIQRNRVVKTDRG